MRRLEDQSIVIVGGTTGLGLSAAKACALEGARLVLVGRNPDSAKAAINEVRSVSPSTDVITLEGDAIDPTTATKAIDQAIAKFGRFDSLYHVAGGSGRKMGDGPLHQITDDGWNKTFALNLTSSFNSARAATQAFLNRKTPGSILLMGSVLGFSPSPKYFVTHAYAATKSAVVGFVKSCGAYYAASDIRFNVIAPALVETPMAQRAAQDEVILNFIHTKQPLDGGRIGKASDLDGAVVWLLSAESKFVTGQTIVVDGGWTVSEGQIPE
jgi:NAD(P)-dependent dehydrogenase (short-subunit alcohol dehydrogenase family)